MTSRPKLAIKIAECIAEWADIETMLGICLGLLLNTDSKAAVMMYTALENRAAQLRMLLAAAQAKLPKEHFEVFEALMSRFLKPAMKERDRLAHWCWGYSIDLPDDLLLAPPDQKIITHMNAISPPSPAQFSWDKIYVVTEDDLNRMLVRIRVAEDNLSMFMGTVWQQNQPDVRNRLLSRLSGLPEIQSWLGRRHASENRAISSPPPDSEASGEK